MQSNTLIEECLQQKEFKQYSTRIENIEMKVYNQGPYNHHLINSSKKSGVIFSMNFPSSFSNIHEEILIFDDTGLIGSLGGSLGLFVGFSLFGYIITFLDVVLDKWAELKNARQNLNISI